MANQAWRQPWLLPLALYPAWAWEGGPQKQGSTPRCCSAPYPHHRCSQPGRVWPSLKDGAAGPGHPVGISQPAAAGRCPPEKTSICCSVLRMQLMLLERGREAKQEVTDGPPRLGC